MTPFNPLRGLERAIVCLVVLLLVACFFAGRAMADTLFVTEFVGPPTVSVYYQAANAPASVNQTVAIGVASVQSAVFGSTTRLVRIHGDIACSVVVGGTSPTATATSMRLAAGQTEYFVVIPGQRLAVIAAATP